EADVVLAGQRVFTALELAVDLRLEVRIECSAANALQRQLRFDLELRRLPGAKRCAGPFPNIADELQYSVGAGAAFERMDRHCSIRPAAPNLRQSAIHRIAPGKSALHGALTLGEDGPARRFHPFSIGGQ